MDRTEPVICSSCTGITVFLLKLNRYNRFFTQAEPLTSGVNRSKKLLLYLPERCNIPNQFMLASFKTLPNVWIDARTLCRLGWPFVCCINSLGEACEPYEHEREYMCAEEYTRLSGGHPADET